MQLLKRETSIPLPDVLDFSSNTENVLRCPYIIMSFVSGTSLYDVWFGHRLHGVSPVTVQTRRLRALEGIAAAMAQLAQFAFSKSGSLRFGEDGKVSSVGPMRRMDNKAMLDRWFIHNNPEDTPIYAEIPASDDPKVYYTHMMDRHPESNPIPRGFSLILQQLISWIPQPGDSEPFVLAHPDFDIQNFIVSEEGELLGIIDWDGVAAVPRTLGNERYPGWLTRDWDPAMYGYKASMYEGVAPEGVWEDSPDCLAFYRRVYSEMIAKHSTERRLGSTVDVCPMSLITENLAIAAHDPACRNEILRKMVGDIWQAAGQEGGMYLLDLARKVAEGNVDATQWETLRDGFNALLSKKLL